MRATCMIQGSGVVGELGYWVKGLSVGHAGHVPPPDNSRLLAGLSEIPARRAGHDVYDDDVYDDGHDGLFKARSLQDGPGMMHFSLIR